MRKNRKQESRWHLQRQRSLPRLAMRAARGWAAVRQGCAALKLDDSAHRLVRIRQSHDSDARAIY